MYIKRKGSIAGPAFKIPLMGPFLQALDPKFDSYLAQWASGPLSCVSVFHKYVSLHFLRSAHLNQNYLSKCTTFFRTKEARKDSRIERALIGRL